MNRHETVTPTRITKTGFPPVTDAVLGAIAHKIRDVFQPQKIILYGSYATGSPSPDSDVDLLVIMETKAAVPERDLVVSDLFRPRPCPMDILVYTPQEVEEGVRRRDPFLREVLERGRVLYERE